MVLSAQCSKDINFKMIFVLCVNYAFTFIFNKESDGRFTMTLYVYLLF